MGTAQKGLLRKKWQSLPGNPSFDMTTTNIFKDVFLWHTTHLQQVANPGEHTTASCTAIYMI